VNAPATRGRAILRMEVGWRSLHTTRSATPFTGRSVGTWVIPDTVTVELATGAAARFARAAQPLVVRRTPNTCVGKSLTPIDSKEGLT
jgi:hypothetical protein